MLLFSTAFVVMVPLYSIPGNNQVRQVPEGTAQEEFVSKQLFIDRLPSNRFVQRGRGNEEKLQYMQYVFVYVCKASTRY